MTRRPRRLPLGAKLAPEEALALWADFPVDADPRPIVLTGPVAALRGFTKQDPRKAAPLVSAVELPERALTLLQPHPKRRWTGDPLRVLAAERVQYVFWTDRGRRALPAYRIEIEGAVQPSYVLDPEVEAASWWPAEVDLRLRDLNNGLPARLAPDGVSVEVGWFGDVRLDVVESRTAAVLVPHPVEPVEEPDAVALVARPRLITVRLSSRLGARVLLAPAGDAVTVVAWDAAEGEEVEAGGDHARGRSPAAGP